jgi:hypothetical protein
MRRQPAYLLGRLAFQAVRAPLVTDDGTQGAVVGQQWQDNSQTPADRYVCVSVATGAAVWRRLTGAAVSASNLAHLGLVPSMIQIPVLFSEFTGFAALTGSVTAFTLPAGCRINAIDIVQKAADAHFAGPAITACHLEVGIAGTLAKYAAATDVFTAGANLSVGVVAGYESLTAGTAILVTAVAIGANLSVLTAGHAVLNVELVNPNASLN